MVAAVFDNSSVSGNGMELTSWAIVTRRANHDTLDRDASHKLIRQRGNKVAMATTVFVYVSASFVALEASSETTMKLFYWSSPPTFFLCEKLALIATAFSFHVPSFFVGVKI